MFKRSKQLIHHFKSLLSECIVKNHDNIIPSELTVCKRCIF